LEHNTLDGVIQAQAGKMKIAVAALHTGEITPYSDALRATAMPKQMHSDFDLLLGRKTFEIWEPDWSNHVDI